MDVKVIQPADPGKDRRVIYECNFAVEAGVVQEFMAYLRAHMAEIVRLDSGKLFDRATLCVAETEGQHDAGRYHLCVRYRARSRFRLQEYFDRAGDRLRRDMLEKWGGRFEVTRRILAVDCVIEADGAGGGGGGAGGAGAGAGGFGADHASDAAGGGSGGPFA